MADVVIAGGTGGLGGEATRLLASDYRVVASYHKNAERAQSFADVATVVQADITDADSRRRLLDAATDLFGVVVFTGDPFRGVPPDEAMRLSAEVNYIGPILLAREAAERMKAAKTRGSIVLVSTMQAVALFPGSTPYAGAKAALVHAARILAKECRGSTDIRVNVICPGVIAAGMAEASIASGKYARYLSEDSIPSYGEARHIARAVQFLIAPDTYITGQVLTIDGGLTL